MARKVGGGRVMSGSGPQAKTKSAPILQQEQRSIPEPFEKLSPALASVVARLPRNHVYAIHTDATPISLKRNVFVIPVLLNMVIALGLVWRLFAAAPVYWEQIVTILGHQTAWTVDPSRMTYTEILVTVGKRTGLLAVDYVIFALLGSWPWEFVFGSKYTRHTGALDWRWSLGFRENEVIVRQGRRWDQLLLYDGWDEDDEQIERKNWTLDHELNLKFKVEEAMRKSYTAKTGYSLLDKDWELDFRAMIDVQHLVDKKEIDPSHLDHVVLVYHQEQWLIWRVHASVEAAQIKHIVTNAEQDGLLANFRQKLETLGAEDVFFRWIEIVQYESSLPGGFTQGKQAEAMRELKRLLTERGIDHASFWDQVGGQEGIPGLQSAG